MDRNELNLAIKQLKDVHITGLNAQYKAHCVGNVQVIYSKSMKLHIINCWASSLAFKSVMMMSRRNNINSALLHTYLSMGTIHSVTRPLL